MTIRARHLLICLALMGAADAFGQAAANDCSTCTTNCASACLQSTSRLDALMNPTKGSDENFFTSAGTPPNIMFLLGTNRTMQNYPTQLPTGTDGCTDAALVTGMSWFDLGSADPAINGSIPVDPDTNFSGSATPFFETGKYYVSLRTRLPIQGTDTPWSLDSSFRDTSSDTVPQTACDRYGFNAATGCATCLTSKGWYKGSSNRWVLSGRVLNVRAPKFVVARKVLKDTVANAGNVRMGVAIFGPDTGFYDQPVVIHPVKPNCNLASPFTEGTLRNDIRVQINQVAFTNPERSIGEALFGLGAYFSSERQDGKWANWFTLPLSPAAPANYPGSAGWNDGAAMWTNGLFLESGGQDLSICWACQASAVIVLSDGAPEADNSVPASKIMDILIANGERHPDNTLVSFSPNSGGTCPNTASSGGINYCNLFSSTKCACDTGSFPLGPDDTNRTFMDEVAFFMSHTDLRDDLPGKQVVRTYTVGYGDNSPMLQSMALAGDALFFRADSPQQLQAAILSSISDIVSRANVGFSSASVSTVQALGSSTSAILSRFAPQTNKLWPGKLYRFGQYNEFVNEVNYNPTEPLPDGGTDNDQNDTFTIDTSGAIVVEDATGKFVRRGTATAATPFWEAGAALVAKGHAARTVWTVIDSDNDGALTSADNRVAFTSANSAVLAPYLGVLGTPFCPTFAPASNGTMFAKFGFAPSDPTLLLALGLAVPASQADLDAICVKTLIEYVRGRDLTDEDADTNRNETRDSVLGDIFHSSPVVVQAPMVDTEFCKLALNNQCVSTLFSTTIPGGYTTLATTSETDCSGSSVNMFAYDAYANAERKRDEIVLVGANDGMLHAFHNGDATQVACNPVGFTNGTGNEEWAFVPPDLMPRLQDMVFGHAYYVDGDIAVRDIWADEAPFDGIKQKAEFHTVAVVAEGRGGTHYFAIDLAFDSSGNLANPIGGVSPFRWMYPQPCSDEASKFAKTLFPLGPRPPPIGPVLLDTSTLSPAPGNPVARKVGPGNAPIPTTERWVAMLSGGWSPGLEKGHGVYMVDVWNGKVNGRSDNLLWKFEHNKNGSNDQTKPQRRMDYSIVAPVSMVDYGTNLEGDYDGFFDTAVVGDTGGAVWLARFFKAGKLDSTTKLISNWAVARAFEMDRDGVSASIDDDGMTSTNKKSMKNRWPFFNLMSVSKQFPSGRMRIYGGTGNRYALLEPKAGTCRFDNMAACAKLDCDEAKVDYKIKKNTLDMGKAHMHWKAQEFEHFTQDTSTTTEPICGANGSTVVTAEFSSREIKNCKPATGPNVDPGDIGKVKVECGKDAVGNFSCKRTDALIINTADIVTDGKAPIMSGLGMNRFFSLWVYGDKKEFNEDATSSGPGYNTAEEFDALRLSDRMGSQPISGQLVNVSSNTCTASTCALPGALPGGNTQSVPPNAIGADGWFLDYPALDNRTAGGSVLINGCLLWNSILPANTVVNGCTVPPTAKGRFYQADFITGQPNCAAGFKDAAGNYVRSLDRDVVSPPPEPGVAIQRSRSGLLRYSAMIVEPGSSQATEAVVSAAGDALRTVYMLPVSRALHNCRHVAGATTNANCVETPP